MLDDPLLDEATSRAFAVLAAAGGDLDRLDELDRTLVIVTSAQGLIDNGGLRGFFENDFPGTPPYDSFVAAYRHAGAVEVAAAIARAAARYPFRDPHLHVERRRDWHAACAARGERPFEDLDVVACGNEQVWMALARLARGR
ncbi:MAG: DUF4375 domain-containing protein [Planctomycetes bacterium]|nr:DUF4375 domain-containing protein [Planctomycetota bacterium]